jgi:hypothetical protein
MAATDDQLWVGDGDVVLLRFAGRDFVARRAEITQWVSRELGPGSVPTANYDELPFLAVRDPRNRAAGLAFPAAWHVLPPIAIDPARALIALGLDRALSIQFSIENQVGVNGFTRLVAGGDPDPNLQANYPEIDFSATPPVLDARSDIELPTRHGRLVAVNLSLGTNEIIEPADEDPVNLAIRFAGATVPVVVAAGNNGYISNGDDTMNAWARPSTVISVAATTDAHGGTLAATSSVGSTHQRSIHPAVAAYGVSELDSKVRGTSFAAPRVCRQLVVLAAYWQQLVARSQALRGKLEGIPLPWLFFVDKDIDDRRMYRPPTLLPALPKGGTDIEALRQLLTAYGHATGRE